METEAAYLESARKQFLYYKTLGEKAIAQLADDQLGYSPDPDTNSIAVIVKHLAGNMRSRWTDFLTSDGEKPWRDRDAEFEGDYPNREALLADWNDGWNCLFTALDSLAPGQLMQLIYIRNEGHTVVEAINRQLAHYPYHVGQMVFFAKFLCQKPWQTLSIARNQSHNYNAGKFAKEKSVRHFTDDELDTLNHDKS